MTELIERTIGRCENCGKGYRVPDPERTYTCKSCGGTVRARSPEPEAGRGHLEGATTCPTCQAINHRGVRFCVECGGVLGVPPPVERSEAAVTARHEVTNELKRGYRRLDAITWLYRVGALAYAVTTLLAVLALTSPEVSPGVGILTVALSTLVTAFLFMGAFQTLFRPFVWTLAGASLLSIVAVTHLIVSEPLGFLVLWNASWAVVFWVATVPTLRIRKLIEDNTDLYIAHHASRHTLRSLEAYSARDRHERLLDVMRKAARRSWRISAAAGGAVCLASAVGTYTVHAKLRPEQLSRALDGFQAAWNDSDLEAIAEFFPPMIRARQSVWLAGVTGEYAWTDSLPRLNGGQRRQDDDDVWVDYELGDLRMSTSWALDGRKWVLIGIELPQPPIEAALERFRRAWRSSDPKAIAAFFPADYQERMRGSIETAVDRRGWTSFPPILETRLDESDEKGVPVTLSLEGGELTTRWLFRGDGRWGLQSLKFP